MSAVNVTFTDERLRLKKNKGIIHVNNDKMKTKQYKGKIMKNKD